MPHCIVDYSQDVATEVDIDRLLEAVHLGALDSGLFPEQTPKHFIALSPMVATAIPSISNALNELAVFDAFTFQKLAPLEESEF